MKNQILISVILILATVLFLNWQTVGPPTSSEVGRYQIQELHTAWGILDTKTGDFYFIGIEKKLKIVFNPSEYKESTNFIINY